MDIDSQVQTEHLIFETRVCTKCGQEKSLLDDYYRSRKDPSKASSYAYECKDCTRKRSLRYHHQKSDHHGLSHDDFSMLLEAQNHQCAICRTTNPGGKSGQFLVDYCDKDVRGLLCANCYKAVECVGDNIHTLKNMIEYLHSS